MRERAREEQIGVAATVTREGRVPEQERLDPIDWATYEPYLWANETLFYQRVGILYGALLHIHRMHTEV